MTSHAALRDVETLTAARHWTTAELRSAGLSVREIAHLVDIGRILRVRRGRYVAPDVHPDAIAAARLGARLDCVSLLAALGVYSRAAGGRLHLQCERGASRLPPRSARIVGHWRRSSSGSTDLCAEIVPALAQACRCQSPRDAVATLDSAWHRNLVDEEGIAAVFALLPRRYRRLRAHLDRRAESGPETLVRLMLRGLGAQVRLQVQIGGVGRVDLLADGWLIVECDSRSHHDGWEAHKRDRRRDLAAAALGYTTVRPIAEDILTDPESVLLMLRDALGAPSSRPPVRNSSDRRLRRRLHA